MPFQLLEPPIKNSQLPDDVKITIDTVADISARDALVRQSGDKCIVSSENKTYVYDGDSWVELPKTTLLSELTDTNISTPSNNEVLTYNGSEWINGAVAGDHTALTNIGTTSHADLDIAVSNSTSHIADTGIHHIDISTLKIQTHGTSFYNTVQNLVNHTTQPGLVFPPNVFNDGVGGLNIIPNGVLIRSLNDIDSDLKYIDFPGGNIAMIDLNLNYVSVYLNAGVPTLDVSLTQKNPNQYVQICTVVRDGLSLTIDLNAWQSITGNVHRVKGDLVSRNDMTETRVPVGSDGQLLSSDSTSNVGLSWKDAITSHNQLSDIGSWSHDSIDSHINATHLHKQFPLTTKGDILGYDTDIQRLAVGSNNQVLTADSSTGTGLAWKTPASGVTDHTLLSNIGSNSHLSIDNHISDSSIHFNSPLFTKGDLITSDVVGNPLKLPVGSDNAILICDSTQPEGLRYGAWNHSHIGGGGTNSHDQIDSHISDSTVHFTSPVTTKGDLFCFGTGNDRLPIGGDGQILVADSVSPQGMSWANDVSPSGKVYVQKVMDETSPYTLTGSPTTLFSYTCDQDGLYLVSLHIRYQCTGVDGFIEMYADIDNVRDDNTLFGTNGLGGSATHLTTVCLSDSYLRMWAPSFYVNLSNTEVFRVKMFSSGGSGCKVVDQTSDGTRYGSVMTMIRISNKF